MWSFSVKLLVHRMCSTSLMSSGYIFSRLALDFVWNISQTWRKPIYDTKRVNVRTFLLYRFYVKSKTFISSWVLAFHRTSNSLFWPPTSKIDLVTSIMKGIKMKNFKVFQKYLFQNFVNFLFHWIKLTTRRFHAKILPIEKWKKSNTLA